MIDCKTCTTSIHEAVHYCNNCGAKVIKNRLSVSNLFKNIFLKITNLDISFYNTCKGLLLKSEQVTIGYIQGVRKIIDSPGQFAIIVLSIYGLYQFFFSDFLDLVAQVNFLSGFQAGFDSDAEDAIINGIIDWMQKHNQFLNFFLIPIIGFLNLKFYRNKSYNFAEHIVIALYAISFSIFLVIILGLIMIPFQSYLVPEYYLYLSAFIQISSILWIIQQTIKGASYKPILSLIISFFALSFIFVILLFIAIFIGLYYA